MSLRRLSKNIPLPRLVQGSYLTIRSVLQQQNPSSQTNDSTTTNSKLVSATTNHTSTSYVPIHIIIEPSWRDDGYVEFQQFFRTTMMKLVPESSNVLNDNHEQEQQQQQQQQSKVDIVVQQDTTMELPSKDRSSVMVPHVTIDLIVQQQHQSTIDTGSIPSLAPLTNSTKLTSTSQQQQQQQDDNYFMKHIASLPKGSIMKKDVMDRIMYDDGDPILLVNDDTTTAKEHRNKAQDDTPTNNDDNMGGTRTNYSDGIIHHISSNDSTLLFTETQQELPLSYVVVKVQVPEKLNLTCELLHSDDDDNRNNSNQQSINKSSIEVTNKLEGDITLRCNNNSDINVTKLRGHDIHLSTQGSGIIYASTLLEAQRLSINCTSSTTGGRIRAKQIHASNIDITIHPSYSQLLSDTATTTTTTSPDQIPIMDEGDDEGSLIDISSMFISGPTGGAIVTVSSNNDNHNNNNKNGSAPIPLQRRAVRIKSHHGPIKVVTNDVSVPQAINPMTDELYPIVELGGVNGSCEVMINTSLSSVNDNNNNNNKNEERHGVDHDTGWSSCLIHVDSLAPDSVSLVSSNKGDISVTLDRKTTADLRLASLSNAECINEVSALLAEEDNHENIVNILKHLETSNESITKKQPYIMDEAITIQTNAFTKRLEASFSNTNVSYIDGWVENNSSEPDSRFERKSRAHESVGKIRLEGAHEQALHSFSGISSAISNDNNNTSDGDDPLRPLLAVVGTAQIQVETVSWIGAIARRYGLEENGRELGRTASRKGRTFNLPANE